jgi:molecular chaperone GrpE (heat shock protein)
MLTSNLYATQSYAGQAASAGAASADTVDAARVRTGDPATDTELASEEAATLRDFAAATAVNDANTERQAALRALRSLEATESRLARNARKEIDEARGKLVHELLPVLDNLDRTIRAAQDHGSDPGMLEGVRMVRQQLEGVLRGYGVERIDAIGQRFDPSLHEAIGLTQVVDPARHGIVVQQAEPGYTFGSRLLRPAKVSVGKHVAPAYAAPRVMWR